MSGELVWIGRLLQHWYATEGEEATGWKNVKEQGRNEKGGRMRRRQDQEETKTTRG